MDVLTWLEMAYVLIASVIYFGFKIAKALVVENTGFVEFLGIVLLGFFAVEIAAKKSIWVKTIRDVVYEIFGGFFRFLSLLFHATKF